MGCTSSHDKKVEQGETIEDSKLVDVVEDCGDLGDEIQKVVFPNACDVEEMDQREIRKLKPQHGLSELYTKYSMADCGPLGENVTKHFQGHVYFDTEVNDAFIVLTRLWEGASNEGGGSYYVVKEQQMAMATLLRMAVDGSWKTHERKPFLIIPIGVTLYEGKLSDERFDSAYDLSPTCVPPGADLAFLPAAAVVVAAEFTEFVIEKLPSAAGVSSVEELETYEKDSLEPAMKLLVVKALKEFDENAFDAVEKTFRKNWQARISKRVEIKFPQLQVTEKKLKPNQLSELPPSVHSKLEHSDVSWTKAYVAEVRTRYFVMRYHIAKRIVVRRIMVERPAGAMIKKSSKNPKRTNK